jgi:hypothetical protein
MARETYSAMLMITSSPGGEPTPLRTPHFGLELISP